MVPNSLCTPRCCLLCTGTIEVSGASNTTKFHEKTPREGRKNENCGGRREKSEILGGPEEWGREGGEEGGSGGVLRRAVRRGRRGRFVIITLITIKIVTVTIVRPGQSRTGQSRIGQSGTGQNRPQPPPFGPPGTPPGKPLGRG